MIFFSFILYIKIFYCRIEIMYEFTHLRRGKTRMYILLSNSRVVCEQIQLFWWTDMFPMRVMENCCFPLNFGVSEKLGFSFIHGCGSSNQMTFRTLCPNISVWSIRIWTHLGLVANSTHVELIIEQGSAKIPYSG